jgi:hypothetical protein
VSHGDEFDSIMHSGGWLIWLGDVSHGFLLKINTLVKPERQEDTGCLAAFIGVSMEAVLFERIGWFKWQGWARSLTENCDRHEGKLN